MESNRYFFDMQICKKLKLRYRLGLLMAGLLLFFALLLQSNAFLSKNSPVHAKVLILEGWLPDYALKEGMQKFKEGEYEQVFTTGGPLESGSYLKEYRDYAHLAKATLVAMGMDEQEVIAVAAADVKRDRTYHSALALKRWIEVNKIEKKRLDLASLGPHSRRSAILFQKALGEDYEIGSIALAPEDYDPEEWYSSSEGVRTTIDELIAYIYVMLLK
jgi:hypothetical protein